MFPLSSRLFLSSFFLFFLLRNETTSAKKPPLPSILFILVDDLGAADVSFNALLQHDGKIEPTIATPNIDRLADRGIRLKKYYTHPVCGPTRCSLISGRTATSMGNPFPTIFGGGFEAGLGTIASELKKRDYSTHFIGKWGIDHPPLKDPLSRVVNNENINGLGPSQGLGPSERGFDTFFGLYSSSHNHFTKEVHMGRAIDWHRHNQTVQLDYPDEILPPPSEKYSTHAFVQEAMDVMQGWTETSPGYLHLSLTAPHDPLQVPEQYLHQCGGIQNMRRKVFCGMVKCVDEGVGKLLDYLELSGKLEHTIVAFTSDNGGAPTVGGFNYPFRGQKATIWEGGIRVPAFIYLPQSMRTSKENHSPVFSGLFHVADWTPTFLGFVDYVRHEPFSHSLGDIDGVDQSPVLLDVEKNKITEQKEGNRDAVVEFNVVMDNAMLIQGNWKLLLGHAGRPDRFDEPNDRYYDSLHRNRFTIEEVLCDLVDGLGPNYFQFGWALRFLIDATIKFLFTNDPRAYYTRDLVSGRDYGERVTVTDDTLPIPRWEYYEFGRVQLYDLENDPFENENVALQNKEKVEEMAKILAGKINLEIPHHLSIQKQFADFAKHIVSFVISLAVALVLLMVLMCWCLCRTSPSKTKRE